MYAIDVVKILVITVVFIILIFVINLVFGILAWVLSHFWLALFGGIIVWYFFFRKKTKR